MAQIPEYSQLSAAAQSLVQQGYTFETAQLIADQNTGKQVQAEQSVKHVDPRMGRTPGPGQLGQFTSLSQQAQQHVVDRGYTFAHAKNIEDEIAASANPATARRQHWNHD